MRDATRIVDKAAPGAEIQPLTNPLEATMQEQQPSRPRQQTPRPQTRRQPSVRPDLERMAAVSRPWWAEVPDVVAKCLTLAFAPVRYAALAAEAAVSLAFVVVFGTVALWWAGYIPDAVVAHYLGQVGDRALAILQASGVI